MYVMVLECIFYSVVCTLIINIASLKMDKTKKKTKNKTDYVQKNVN